MKKSIEVFLSYSHKDKKLLQGLVDQLSLMSRQGVIGIWYDHDIGPGTDWEQAITTHLNTADLILLLVSAAFIASDYCYSQEMAHVIKRHEAGEARVIPVILRPVDWHTAPFGKLQALPSNGKPVTAWRDREEAFLNVALGIRSAIKDLTPLPPIDSYLLAVLNFWKEQRQQDNIPFYTPSLLLALLGISGGVTERAFENLKTGFPAEVRMILESYIHSLKSNKGRSFTNFRWEDRPDVQKAQQLALRAQVDTVTERYLLLGILETESETQKGLKSLLGEEEYRRLIQITSTIGDEALGGTPGIGPFFTAR